VEAGYSPASKFVRGKGIAWPGGGVSSQCWQGKPTVKATLEAINRMQTDGVIGKYAIGGAVGATFYLEPAATLDVDIFVTLPTAPGGLFLSLAPIYDYLKARGGTIENEYVVIGGWPVQFLPPSGDLEQEGVAESLSTAVEGVGTWVMTAEHLVAIALRTGRAKDHIRILQFIEQGAVDREKLQSVLERHGLTSKWKQFEHKYLEGRS
jgi:hypothetical protein